MFTSSNTLVSLEYISYSSNQNYKYLTEDQDNQSNPIDPNIFMDDLSDMNNKDDNDEHFNSVPKSYKMMDGYLSMKMN